MLQAVARFGGRRGAVGATGRISAVSSIRNFSAAKEVVVPEESFRQKVLRFADFSGHLSRFFSRKDHILQVMPWVRVSFIMVTEYERKLLMWLWNACAVMIPVSFWYAWGEWTHMNCRPPTPQAPAFQYLDNRWKGDFKNSQNEKVVAYFCKDCRPFELECKKICRDQLRELGYPHAYPLVGLGFDKPRTHTWGSH